MADGAWRIFGAAKDELKAATTGVIGSNEEDGVARWLAEHGKFLAPPRKS